MNPTESWSHAVELEWQGRQEAQSLPSWAVGDVLSSMPRCLPSSLRSVQLPLDHLVKWEIELCVISVEMVGEAMCLYDGTQWCSVCGEEEGSKNRAMVNPSDQLMSFGYLPSPGHLKDRPWDRIQTSEVESQWCPVMRGWTGGSYDWQCQKRQTDPAEWGLMIWNQLL